MARAIDHKVTEIKRILIDFLDYESGRDSDILKGVLRRDGGRDLNAFIIAERIFNIMKKDERLDALFVPIRDIIWMARRYADGRRTYAPDMFNEAQKKIVEVMGKDILQGDTVPDNFPYATDPDVPLNSRNKLD